MAPKLPLPSKLPSSPRLPGPPRCLHASWIGPVWLRDCILQIAEFRQMFMSWILDMYIIQILTVCWTFSNILWHLLTRLTIISSICLSLPLLIYTILVQCYTVRIQNLDKTGFPMVESRLFVDVEWSGFRRFRCPFGFSNQNPTIWNLMPNCPDFEWFRKWRVWFLINTLFNHE